nr:GTP-binding protein [Marinobacterium litorale]
MAQKPDTEYWALLINEFGQIGIDQALVGHGTGADVSIREIPGGCLCCAQGPQLRVALTQLIARQRPDRLLIEPTGLGHPAGIVQLLNSPGITEAVSLRTIITVVDPAILDTPELIQNPVFAQQVEIADLIAVSKSDLRNPAQVEEACELSRNMYPPKWRVIRLQQGSLPPDLLDHPSAASTHKTQSAPRLTLPTQDVPVSQPVSQPEPGQPIALNHSEQGVHAYSWLFHPDDCFDTERTRRFLTAIKGVKRIKAALRIGHAWLGYNRVIDDERVFPLNWRRDSRLEILSDQPLDKRHIEEGLLACLKQAEP